MTTGSDIAVPFLAGWHLSPYLCGTTLRAAPVLAEVLSRRA
jgi:hypothetical protein